MFYNSKESAYQLLGVYHVHRKPMDLSMDKNRKYAALSYRVKGSSTFHCQGTSFPAGDGCVLYIPAGVDYSHSNAEEELIVVHMLCHNDTEKTIRRLPGTKEVERLFFRLYKAWNAEDPSSYNQSMVALYQLFDGMSREQEKKTAVPAIIAPGVAMLQKEFRNPGLTVAQLAEACYISQVYFRRLYRQHFGTSPLQAITELRFKHAAGLLRSGYYTPKQVADCSGFSDVKYFRTAFTRHFGMTPSEYMGAAGKNRENG